MIVVCLTCDAILGLLTDTFVPRSGASHVEMAARPMTLLIDRLDGPGPRPASNDDLAVVVRDLRRAYGDRVVLRGIELQIRRGEFVALLGRSGSGKSTIFRALSGLDSDVTGQLGVPERRAVVFQEPRLLPWARVLENVTLGTKKGEAVTAGCGGSG